MDNHRRPAFEEPQQHGSCGEKDHPSQGGHDAVRILDALVLFVHFGRETFLCKYRASCIGMIIRSLW